jgi:hypothetical protein
MKRALLAITFGCCGIAVAGILCSAQQTTDADSLQYTAKGDMLRPAKYREWVWLSSGFGMSYQAGSGSGEADPPFDNVFASPAAYRAFLEKGEWPDKTVLLLEVRASKGRPSINQAGHFQGHVIGLEAHVKDSARFPQKWAFFAFEPEEGPGRLIPAGANCYTCHERSGAVDTTFVQFYPTLFDIAKAKHTVTADR